MYPECARCRYGLASAEPWNGQFIVFILVHSLRNKSHGTTPRKDLESGDRDWGRMEGQVAMAGGCIRLRRTSYSNRHQYCHMFPRWSAGRSGGSNKIAATSSLCATMSLSPSTSNEYEPSSAKRRRTSFTASSHRSEMDQSPQDANGSGLPTSLNAAHIPKRGARACTACRKGKNRCEGEVRPDHLLHCRILTARSWPALSARPGRIGTLSTLPIEWYSLCLRKTREEKCPGLFWC